MTALDGRRRLLLRRLWEAVALAGVGSGMHMAARAENDPPEVDEAAAALERSVKAAFVFKFAGFVEWPEQAMPRPETPIRIGVPEHPGTVADREVELAGLEPATSCMPCRRSPS